MKRALITLAVLGLFAACGFPEVGYRSEGDDGGGDARGSVDAAIGAEASGADGVSGAEAAGEAGDATFSGADAPGTGADATSDAPGDASSADASAVDTGVDAPDDVHEAAADAPPVCDEDQDTYTAEGTCGGNDCCDTDAKAHPGQTAFFTQADACGSFDYDCNGQLDAQYPVNLTCGGTGLTECTGGSAFLGNPGCGNSGLFGTCVANGLLACQPGDETTVTQGCH